MPIVLARSGPSVAFLLAVVVTVFARHPALLSYVPTVAAAVVVAAASWRTYNSAAAVWALARVHPVPFMLSAVLTVWGLAAIGGQPTELTYATTSNMAVAR